jgi:hypothetical protein
MRDNLQSSRVVRAPVNIQYIYIFSTQWLLYDFPIALRTGDVPRAVGPEKADFRKRVSGCVSHLSRMSSSMRSKDFLILSAPTDLGPEL